jgi:hypothetical protein
MSTLSSIMRISDKAAPHYASFIVSFIETAHSITVIVVGFMLLWYRSLATIEYSRKKGGVLSGDKEKFN